MNPGGEPPFGPNDQLADGDARGSGGVPSPPGLPVRPNPGGPPGDSGDDGGGGDGPDESEEDTPVHSDDAAQPPRKPAGDPLILMVIMKAMTINKWAKPIPS